jgi:alpha-ribazole phosphatase/probable phosphoglycerate mutase
VTLTLVYETHSTTTDNEAGKATGWLPGELSDAGRVQARALGERRRSDRIAAVYVSDLRRALDTVAIAFAGSDLPVFIDGRLRECNYGRFNGQRREVLDAVRHNHIDRPWPDGESYRQVVERTQSLLGDVRSQWDGQRVLWIGHSANRWALEHLLLGRDLAELVAQDFAWRPGWEYAVD